MGQSPASICEKFHLKSSAFYSIMRRAESIKEAYISGGIKSSAKRVRTSKFDDVDKALLAFLRSCLENRVPTSGEMLLLKGQQLAREFGHDSKPDMSWINRWKRRHSIVQKSFQGEAASADVEASNHFIEVILPTILSRYDPADIWNADETGLFFKCLPGKTHTFKDSRCIGGKLSKERLTVLLAASMEGEKLHPLVIGKSLKPRCFRGVSIFPDVAYRAHPKAWMSGELFRKWLHEVDQLMLERNRNIIMIIDNCPAHPHVEGLQAVELLFLPPNTTSLIQPLDAGIIRSMKAHYRRELAKRHLADFENGRNTQVDIFLALRLIEAAWSNVTPTTIKNCYHHSGFYNAPQNMEEDAAEDVVDGFTEWEALMESGAATETFAEYNAIDSGIVYRSEESSGGPEDQADEVTLDDPPMNEPIRQTKEYQVLEKIWDIQKILRSEPRFAEEVPVADKLEEMMLAIRHRSTT